MLTDGDADDGEDDDRDKQSNIHGSSDNPHLINVIEI